MRIRRQLKRALLATAAMAGGLGAAAAAHAEGPQFNIYGFAQADGTYDFNRVDPSWEDALRPSKIPTTTGQFGSDGQTSFSVKQSRFGVTASQDIAGQPLFVKFEFDLFGVGGDAGQTTIRLRHFYGQWGPLLAGQTNSVFMDVDTFPNTIEYWGPSGMVFLRNPQIRYTYKSGPHEIAVAVEKPSNDIDAGNIREVDPGLGASIVGDEHLPDLTAHYRYDGSWGHVQLAGILRQIGFDTPGAPDNRPKGHETGWGLNLTSNVKVGPKDVLHLAVVYGDGIASYMNDGGVDLAPTAAAGVVPPIVGPPPPGSIGSKAVPLTGLVAYYDHYWNDHWSTSVGWSETHVSNTNFQQANAFHDGQYASVNLLWTPDPHLLFGGEYIWGQRKDKDGASGDDSRIQLSAKYSFSMADFR